MFNIVSVAMLLNQQERPPIKYNYSSSEIHCIISLKLGHSKLNARKYVRCAHTFYLFMVFYESLGLVMARPLVMGLDSPDLIPGGGRVQIFLHSFMFQLVLGSTQPPII